MGSVQSKAVYRGDLGPVSMSGDKNSFALELMDPQKDWLWRGAKNMEERGLSERIHKSEKLTWPQDLDINTVN